MNFTSWPPCLPFSSHRGCSLLLAAAHTQTHPEGCFADLSLIKVTEKNNRCTYMAETAQSPQAAPGYRAGESLGSKSNTRQPPLSPGQDGRRKRVSQDCVELAGD